MTYFPRIKIEAADSPSVDAFGRLRTSPPVTLFDSKQLFNSQPLFWASKAINGATFTHLPDRASTALAVTSTSGSFCVRQTKQRNFYQPGKSLLTYATFVMGSGVDGIRKRLGYFNGSNGVFLEQSGSDINFVICSTVSGVPVETRVSQSSWNLDPFDGSGPSAFTLDPTQAQIFSCDFQWLGVGRVRLGFNISGSSFYGHEFNHANVLDSVYMSTPNLPVRYEIECFGASTGSNLEQICSSVISEGGFEPVGSTRGADRGVSVVSSSGNFIPVIGIRLNPDFIGTVVLPSDFSLISTSNDDFRWAVLLNPTVSGGVGPSWTDITASAVQYDVSRDGDNAVVSGVLIRSGYVAAGQGGAASNSVSDALNSGFTLGADVDGNTDELVLAVENVDAGTKTYLGSLGWRELS